MRALFQSSGQRDRHQIDALYVSRRSPWLSLKVGSLECGSLKIRDFEVGVGSSKERWIGGRLALIGDYDFAPAFTAQQDHDFEALRTNTDDARRIAVRDVLRVVYASPEFAIQK